MTKKDKIEALKRQLILHPSYLTIIEEIEKDLEVLECFKKIDKKELKDFIEAQIRYALNENTWLSACNCDLEKEKPTKHLIKIKEWLENEEIYST